MRRPCCGILMHIAPVGPEQEAPLRFAELRQIARDIVTHAVENAARIGLRVGPKEAAAVVDLPEPDSLTTASTSPS